MVTRLPLRSATLNMPESLRTKNGVRSAWAAPIMRRSLSPPSSPSCASMMLTRPTSASPRPTSGMMTLPPAAGCTSTLRPAFSFIALEMADEMTWLSEPAGSVAKP